MPTSKFSLLVSELAKLVDQLLQAHLEDLDEAFSGARVANVPALKAGSPRNRPLWTTLSAYDDPIGGASSVSFADIVAEVLGDVTVDQEGGPSACNHPTGRASKVSFADAFVLRDVEVDEDDWEDGANAEIPSDTNAVEIVQSLKDMKTKEVHVILDAKGFQREDSTDSSEETRYVEMRAFPTTSTQRSTGIDMSPKHVVQTMQFQMRSPWSDHGDLNLKYSSASFEKFELESRKRKRRSPMESVMSVRYSGMMNPALDKERSCMRSLIQHPDSGMRVLWILACIAFLIYDLIMVPVDLCFGLEDSVWSNIIRVVSVIFWTLDIIYSFLTGVQTFTHLEMRPAWIAFIYFKSWFLFDVLLVTMQWIAVAQWLLPSGQVGFLRTVRFSRLSRLLRVARILKTLKLRKMLRRFIVKFNFSTMYIHVTHGWIGLCCVILLVLHLLTCIWYALGNELEDGWVHANGLTSLGAGNAYIASVHWSVSRLHGFTTSRVVTTEAELLVDALLIFGSLICISFFNATATAIYMTKATSKTIALWKYGIAYSGRHVISPEVDRRLVKFLEVSHSGGLGEVQAQEQVLLQALPLSLRHDLVFEARISPVIKKVFFRDLDLLNERVVRQIVVSATSSQISIEREVIFAYGDGCQSVRFVTKGTFWYAYHSSPVEVLTEDSFVSFGTANSSLRTMHSQKSHNSLSLDSSDNSQLGEDACISEAVLWTQWMHCGSLLAQEDSIAISLDAQQFAEVIEQHRGFCLQHTLMYARHFVWRLNHLKRLHDLIEFPNLTIGNLDGKLFDGSIQDHFLFISHYKVEAGTEATLMRDSWDTFLAENPGHAANNLHSPIFIDSEDLSDLAELKGHVKNSQTLVLLLTPSVLSRPWCLVEIVTAVQNNVNIVPVEIQRPGSKYQYPDEEFYSAVLSGSLLSKDSIDLLEAENVDLMDVEQAIRQVFLKIALPFSPHKSKAVREAELSDIWKRCNRPGKSCSVLSG